MCISSVCKQFHCHFCQIFISTLSARMSQKSLLSFFQRKPVGSLSSGTQTAQICSDRKNCSDDLKLWDTEKSNNKTSLETSNTLSDAKSLSKQKLKSPESSNFHKMSTKNIKKIEKGGKSPAVKDIVNGKSSFYERYKSSDKEIVETNDIQNSEESPEITKSPTVQTKRRRVAVIMSDSEDDSTEVLPLSKKPKSSNEIDEKNMKKTDVEVISKKDNSVKIVTENTSDTETEVLHEDVTIDNADSEVDEVAASPELAEKKRKIDARVSDTPKVARKTLSYLGTKKKRSPKLKKTSTEKKAIKSLKNGKIISETQIKNDENGMINSIRVNSPKTSGENISENTKTDHENEDVQVISDSVSGDKENNIPLLNRKNASQIIGLEYNPSNEKYDPVKDAYWKFEEKTPYLALAKTLQKVEETSARLMIIKILSNYFRSVMVLNRKDLIYSIYLCLNKLGPAWKGQELGIAETKLVQAIARSTGRTEAQIKSDAAKSGDLGIVAERSRSDQTIMGSPAPLTVEHVYKKLQEIAAISGKDASKKKQEKICNLLVACRDCEARFLIRSLSGKMRIGLAEQSIVQALALACTVTPPNQQYPPAILNASSTISSTEFKKRVENDLLILKTAYCECPDYEKIVNVLIEHGINALTEHCTITPGIPVKPMLAHPTKGVQEVLQRFDGLKFTCEWKYDGERAQIHLLKGEDEKINVQIYSRNQEDNTSRFPDIIADIKQAMKITVKSCILDTEAVAWDREQKKIMPFQILSTRKRKDANADEIKVNVCVFLFDLLYLNGESLTGKTLAERRKLLKEYFLEVDEKFKFVTSLDTTTMEEVQEFLEESVKGNCEGLMVKTLDTEEATYEIAKRSRNWLKLKKDYLEGVGDTLDLVVVGGYIGKGKRTGHYGGFLLASYDTDTDEFQTICKIGTGFSDEALAKHSEFLKQHIIPAAKPYYRYDSSHEPDVWFDAVQVWEVKCADLSLSPVYLSAVGLVDPEKGISLRFPRFLRVREDKKVEQATTAQQVAELYKNQDQIKNGPITSTFNEEDF